MLVSALAAGEKPSAAVDMANLAEGLVVNKLGTTTISREELCNAIKNAELK